MYSMATTTIPPAPRSLGPPSSRPPRSLAPHDAISDENLRIAALFEEVADLLELDGADAHRVHAYREGAQTLRALRRPAREVLARGGARALVALRHIGRGLAAAIEEYLLTGELRLLTRLRGKHAPVELFASLPGVGPKLAARIVTKLGVLTLEDLELAAHDGRLLAVEGFGRERVALLRAVLGERLRRPVERELDDAPSVATLLAVDRAYREAVRAPSEHHAIKRIAPTRFNPRHVAWLPVMHLVRDGWSFTAMFSNTATAHRLGKTHDWVVLIFERESGYRGQHTVVTEHRGPDEGRRVVRGRELECRDLFASEPRPQYAVPDCLLEPTQHAS